LFARRLGVLAMRICSTPASEMYPATIWEVYAPPHLGGGALGYRRTVCAMNDGGRWVFEESGEPYPFEDLDKYELPRKRDRFTREMLIHYLERTRIGPATGRVCAVQSLWGDDPADAATRGTVDVGSEAPAPIARLTIASHGRTLRDEFCEPGMALRAGNKRDYVELLGQRLKRLSEIIVDVPKGSIRAQQPSGADRSHQRNAAVHRRFMVGVETLLRGIRNPLPNPIRDVFRKQHPVRPTYRRSAAGARGSEATDEPVSCNALLGGSS
jgi:hypothetical protein